MRYHLQRGHREPAQEQCQYQHSRLLLLRYPFQPDEALLSNWFIAALPQKMAFIVLEKRTTTLQEVVDHAEFWQESQYSSRINKRSKDKKKSKYQTFSDSES